MTQYRARIGSTLLALLIGLTVLSPFGTTGSTVRAEQVSAPVSQVGPLSPLVVETRGGPRRFRVEVAATAAERNRGLMFREQLPPDQGMLFDFPGRGLMSFWMRNTPIPLDIIFIDLGGVITRIHENAVPFDETNIPSGGPAIAVLELNGGTARLTGIHPGDRVRHAIFGDDPGQ